MIVRVNCGLTLNPANQRVELQSLPRRYEAGRKSKIIGRWINSGGGDGNVGH